jgi:hypothetical protein
MKNFKPHQFFQKALQVGLLSIVAFQTGCMSSPVSPGLATPAASSFPEWALLGLGTAGGAAVGQSIQDSWGAPVGAAVALAGTAAYLQYQNDQKRQLVAEAKEEARREERAKLMQDYWIEATGQDSLGNWRGNERDVRYDAGVYDGIAYERRDLSRPLYFQEPPRN